MLIVLIFLASCGTGNGEKIANTAFVSDSPVAHVPAPAYDKSLIKGRVTDSIVCRGHTTQSYALYLPAYYAPDKKWPCIYFFDSHGLGALPLNAYCRLAELYGFVLVGSDFSKNGIPWEVAKSGANSLIEDTRTRINIDPKRIYTAGFSGGSRVAVTLAIQDSGVVAGVIGCAAGFPKVQFELQHKFDYCGMVGDQDFNLAEMRQWDKTLGEYGFSHQLLTSGDVHGWTSARDFETALLWIQVNAMKKQVQPKNDTLIATLKKDYDQRIESAMRAGEWIKSQELLQGMISIFDGLSDISVGKKQLTDLIEGESYKKAVALQKQLQEEELKGQQDLVQQFAAQDEKWWSKKISDLNHEAKTKEETQMNCRLLNYLGLVSYANSSHALEAGDLANASTFIKIFKMADPRNPDCSYLLATYYIKKGDSRQAISSLKEAAALGFSDIGQLLSDPVFNSLQQEAQFKVVSQRVRGNVKSHN